MPVEIRGRIQLSYGLVGFVEGIIYPDHICIDNLLIFGPKGEVDQNEMTDQESSEYYNEAIAYIQSYVNNIQSFPVLFMGTYNDFA